MSFGKENFEDEKHRSVFYKLSSSMYLTKQRQLCGGELAERRQKPNLNWLLISVRTNEKYSTGWLQRTK